MAIGADISGPTIRAPVHHLRVVPDEAVADADDLVEVLLPRAGVAVAVLLGEHDLATRDALHELFRLLVAGNDLVVVDLSQVKFIDASTLETLVHADEAARMKGGRLRLQLGADRAVRRVLEITNLARVLECAASREAALSWPACVLVLSPPGDQARTMPGS